MRRALAAGLAVTLALQPALVCAQQALPAAAPSPRAQAQPPGSAAPPAAGTVSFDGLGVSLERIKRELGDREPTKNATPLKLDFYVEVTGIAPPIQLFTKEELAAGPVPGAPPTHWEMVAQMTKPEFRAPAVPIGSLAIMGIAKLIKWEAERQRRRKAEEERLKREEELRAKYPDLVVK